MRLDKFLALEGRCTRSGAKEWLRRGRVTVNGAPARDGAAAVDPEKDEIALDGEAISGISSSSESFSIFLTSPSPLRPISSERIAFWKASLKLLPMLMTSPTAFIWVPRWSLACGNFSNAQRANLTTT